eukprot:434552_1
MHVSTSSGSQCQPRDQGLGDYGNITINTSYHLLIAFNNTNLTVRVSGGGKADWERSWPRDATLSQFIGQEAPVWWMTNKYDPNGWDFNRGGAIFSNVIIKSNVFGPTTEPTADPTTSPTTSLPSAAPIEHPSITPTYTPSIPPITANPTPHPSVSPTSTVSTSPSRNPSAMPSASPTTAMPTVLPSMPPSSLPTTNPTTATMHPSTTPTTVQPSLAPSTVPTANPTMPGQTASPSITPTIRPSDAPSAAPTTATPTTPSSEPSINPSVQPSNGPSDEPTTAQPTSHPSTMPTQQPSIHPTKAPSHNPTKRPSDGPTDDPTHRPSLSPSQDTSSPSIDPSYPPSTAPTTTPTIFVSDWLELPTEDSPREQSTGFWNQNPYTYIFYSAIIFVALLLIVMAIGCYCKFKPPSDDHEVYDKYVPYDVTGQAYVAQAPHAMPSVDKEEGYGHHESLPKGTNAHHQSHLILTESNTEDIDLPDVSRDVMIAGHPRMHHGETTGSQTSDEDVLTGAFGGHITAGADQMDEPFPRDKLRTINDDNAISPHGRNGYRAIAEPMEHHMRYHHDSSERDYRAAPYEEEMEEEYYEEEDIYEDNVTYDDDYDEEDTTYGTGGHHHMTIGAPEDYTHNRHHVDGDEAYIVEMITKDELRRKIETDTTHKEEDEYMQGMYHHQQKESATLDDIVRDIHQDYGDHRYHDVYHQ